MNNDITINPDVIREYEDNSIMDPETIRQIALYANKTGDVSLLPKIKKGFQYNGLYPEVMSINNIVFPNKDNLSEVLVNEILKTIICYSSQFKSVRCLESDKFRKISEIIADMLLTENNMNEWIDINVRVPESGRNVLLYSEKGGVAEGTYKSEKGVYEQFRWSTIITPTHWMYLPNPPSEEQQK